MNSPARSAVLAIVLACSLLAATACELDIPTATSTSVAPTGDFPAGDASTGAETQPSTLPIGGTPAGAALAGVEEQSNAVPWAILPTPDGLEGSWWKQPGAVEQSQEMTLQGIGSLDPALARTLAESPWVADGLTIPEALALHQLQDLAEKDLAAANPLINNLGALDALRPFHAEVLESLYYGLLAGEAGTRQIVGQPWFQDGLTAKETALAVVLLGLLSERRNELFDGLVAGGYVQTRPVPLPPGAVDLFLVSRAAPADPGAILDDLSASVESIHQLLQLPWPTSEIILYLEPDYEEPEFREKGGFHAGSHMVLISEPGSLGFPRAIYHEPAHYFMGPSEFPEWLREGGADYFAYYALAAQRPDPGRLLEYLQVQRSKDISESCQWATSSTAGGPVNNIWELVNYEEPQLPGIVIEFGYSPFKSCPYDLGLSFLLAVHHTLGPEVVAASLRELYLAAVDSGRPVTEEEIYQVFLSNTPPGLEEQFRSLYYYEHGRPIPGYAPTAPPQPTSIHYGRPIPGGTPPGDYPSPSDRDTLAGIYRATGGERWKNSQNWLSDLPLPDWHGVESRFPEFNPAADYRVTILDLAGNGLTGPIHPQVGDLAWLEDLRLGSNPLTGPIPAELGNLPSLRLLSVPDSGLTGPIPPELGSTTLVELFLSFNELTDPIPPELGNLRGLRTLLLASNELTGPIPPELGQLSKLEALDLSDNQLTGPIPPELGQLTNLKVLRLIGNQLTGCIPPALRQVPQSDLEWLDLPDC